MYWSINELTHYSSQTCHRNTGWGTLHLLLSCSTCVVPPLQSHEAFRRWSGEHNPAKKGIFWRPLSTKTKCQSQLAQDGNCSWSKIQGLKIPAQIWAWWSVEFLNWATEGARNAPDSWNNRCASKEEEDDFLTSIIWFRHCRRNRHPNYAETLQVRIKTWDGWMPSAEWLKRQDSYIN